MEKINLSKHKDSPTYLEQINGASNEKSSVITRHILSGELPKINNETRVLEIGIGSGSGIEKIKEEVKDPKLVIYGLDMLEPLARRVHNPDKNIYSIAGDLSKLPFAERSMSAINFSSVLHEGISYSTQILSNEIQLEVYLQKILGSLISTLEIGGVLAYRDPGLPEKSSEVCTTRYSKTVAAFIKSFNHDFNNIYTKITKDAVPQIIFDGTDVLISASIRYHREIQRHLITYLDLAFIQNFGTSLKNTMSEHADDELNEDSLKQIITELSTDKLVYDSWLKREGSEVYTYKSLAELAKLLQDIKGEWDFDFEVLESYETERPEYSKLLSMVSDTTLRDTKQNLVIKRTK
jgi:SAM-dependent methyltransferase